jgi:citrate lyase subunit beta/citryl-CoA lyase
VAAGKSELAEHLARNHGALHVRTRQLMFERAERNGEDLPNERAALQHFGDRLDAETGGQWVADDLAAMSGTNADAVLVPKIRTRQDLLAYDNALKGAHRALQLWTMIETALSLFHLEDIASAARTSRLTCFVMGTNDLAKELHMQLDHQRTPFTSLLALTVAAARAHGVALLDGVYNAFDDSAGFEAQCRQGVEYGFDGKTLIHPKQIDICNAAFSPSAAAISWAQQVKAEFALPENRDKGAVKVAGSMVERLHLAQAEQLLALDAAIKANGSI